MQWMCSCMPLFALCVREAQAYTVDIRIVFGSEYVQASHRTNSREQGNWRGCHSIVNRHQRLDRSCWLHSSPSTTSLNANSLRGNKINRPFMSISTRAGIAWKDGPLDEPTDTLVLTGNSYFVDVRVRTSDRKLDWAFAGSKTSLPGPNPGARALRSLYASRPIAS